MNPPGARSATASPAGLVARTVPLPVAPDLIAIGGRPGGVLWQREEFGVAGRGAALRISLPRGLDSDEVASVAQVLSSLATEDSVGRPGSGPVALGALPFRRDAPAELVVPRWLAGRHGDSAWLTTITPVDGTAAGPAGEALDPMGTLKALESGGPTGRPPDSFRLDPAIPHERWQDIVAGAVAAIATGRVQKVVVSRRVDVSANRPFVLPDILGRLATLYPSCMVFHVGGFVGASPELLVELRGREVRSHPLAGTVARSGDAAADRRLISALVNSAKERSEHRFVVDALTGALGPVCSELHVPEQPDVLGLRNVSHLATPIRGLLRAESPASALQLVARVHPTPAVAGTPTAAALSYLNSAEGFDRGRFAGPVGWLDSRGDGSWALGIRSAAVEGAHASMYAGVGVVADSDPASELAETQLKLQALLAALVRP